MDEAAKTTSSLPISHFILDSSEKSSIHRSALIDGVKNSWSNRAAGQRIGQIKRDFVRWEWAERPSRREETLLSNFRLGNPPLNKYLHRIKQSQSPHCPWCPGIVEDSEHFLLRCRMYRTQRASLHNHLIKLNIRNPTLAILLGGGGFSPHKNKLILDLTCEFCRKSNRFKYI